MISDTLSDAVSGIDRYLTDPVFAGFYNEPGLREWIKEVRNGMEKLRIHLDSIPPQLLPLKKGGGS